jgi:hypothetical protein
MQITIDIFNRPDSLCPLISQIGAKSPKNKESKPKIPFQKIGWRRTPTKRE